MIDKHTEKLQNTTEEYSGPADGGMIELSVEEIDEGSIQDRKGKRKTANEN